MGQLIFHYARKPDPSAVRAQKEKEIKTALRRDLPVKKSGAGARSSQ